MNTQAGVAFSDSNLHYFQGKIYGSSSGVESFIIFYKTTSDGYLKDHRGKTPTDIPHFKYSASLDNKLSQHYNLTPSFTAFLLNVFFFLHLGMFIKYAEMFVHISGLRYQQGVVDREEKIHGVPLLHIGHHFMVFPCGFVVRFCCSLCLFS